MKITLTIDDNLLIRASQLTGIVEPINLLKEGLNTLIALKSHQRPAKLEQTQRETSIVLKNRQRLSEVGDIEQPSEIFQAIMEISQRCAALPNLDYRTADEILGYNDIGVFS